MLRAHPLRLRPRRGVEVKRQPYNPADRPLDNRAETLAALGFALFCVGCLGLWCLS